jgi:hypothetical protein
MNSEMMSFMSPARMALYWRLPAGRQVALLYSSALFIFFSSMHKPMLKRMPAVSITGRKNVFLSRL